MSWKKTSKWMRWVIYPLPVIGGLFAIYDLTKQYHESKEERKKGLIAADFIFTIPLIIKVAGTTAYLINGVVTHVWNPAEYNIVQIAKDKIKNIINTENPIDSTKINKLEKTINFEDCDSTNLEK
ncbi:MAG: hypothetical protein WC812_02610 [Candidatus Pacearchaeota archaeon]|jgi:hypothetical protein